MTTTLQVDGWVTYSRIWHPKMNRWLITQKRNGCTRVLVRVN